MPDSDTVNELTRTEAKAVILDAVGDALEPDSGVEKSSLSAETALIGRDAVVDSLGLVQIIADVEEAVVDRSGVAIDLTDERALSQENSPFRTVDSLADYVMTCIQAPPTT